MTDGDNGPFTVSMTVNGQKVQATVSQRQSLVDFLRQEIELTGSHVGCEHGVCGACTIRLNGEIVRGCLVFAVQADGCSVETVEGMNDDPLMIRLQDAFVAKNALQCGFCTPGMLLTAHELISSGSRPDRTGIRGYMSGNYCRCTGYQAIVEAVEHVMTDGSETGADATGGGVRK